MGWEGSNSTLRKEDVEDESAAFKCQITNVSSKQIEVPQVEPGKQDPIEVEDSAPERGLEEETIP